MTHLFAVVVSTAPLHTNKFSLLIHVTRVYNVWIWQRHLLLFYIFRM